MVIRKIIEIIRVKDNDKVIEVGPGLGALTFPLNSKLNNLHVVEIDNRAIQYLEKKKFENEIKIHFFDVLKFDFSKLGDNLRILGSLPYHITSPFLFYLDNFIKLVRDCHFVLQREVVQRIVARPGEAEYGRLSVMLQYRWRVENLFDIEPSAFRPEPKVWSSVMRMVPIDCYLQPPKTEKCFVQIVSAAFSKRRKTLRNALAGIISEQDFLAGNVDPASRAESLSVSEFIRLAQIVSSKQQGH